VLIAAFLAALGSVFYSPAASTLMIDIIPDDDMVRGQSIFSGTNSLVNMIGTAFSGVMVAFLGVPFIVVLNGLSNLYSAVSEMFIHVPKTVQQGTEVSVKNVLRDSKAAVKEIFSNPCLRLFVPCALILNLLAAGPLTLLLPFCMEKGFTVDMYGYLMSAWTAACVICTLLLGVVKLKPKTRFLVMAVGFSASGVFLILGFLSTNFLLMCGLAFVGAFLNCAGNTVFNASLMLALPEKNRGAILGFIQSASVGGTALSTVLYGVLGDIFPLYIVFTIGTVLSLIPMLYMCGHPRTKEFVVSH
jgi:MFS family permease